MGAHIGFCWRQTLLAPSLLRPAMEGEEDPGGGGLSPLLAGGREEGGRLYPGCRPSSLAWEEEGEEESARLMGRDSERQIPYKEDI